MSSVTSFLCIVICSLLFCTIIIHASAIDQRELLINAVIEELQSSCEFCDEETRAVYSDLTVDPTSVVSKGMEQANIMDNKEGYVAHFGVSFLSGSRRFHERKVSIILDRKERFIGFTIDKLFD